MSENTNKFQNIIQIKARLLSSIIDFQKNYNDTEFIKNQLEELHSISDTDAVLNILIKELLKDNSEQRDFTIHYLLKELVEQEKIEKILFEKLALPSIKDSLKTKLVDALRDIGKHIDYNEYVSYFENPDEIIDADTAKLLEDAIANPESQIDFLDFIVSLPEKEKEMLLESMIADYDGDNLANILTPLILSNPYSDLAQVSIKAIGETKSVLAFPVLSWLVEYIDDLQVKTNAQKSLNLLKLSGVKTDVTKEYYKRLFKNSSFEECLVSIPDGNGSIGLIFSRKKVSNDIQMFALVLNDTDGIVDCFGFNNITIDGYNRIVHKFFANNNQVVSIDEKLCKFLLVEAENLSRKKFKTVPYEYIAWKLITNDIDYEFIDIKKSLSKIELSASLLENLYAQTYLDKWFFTIDDNEGFASLIRKIVEEKIYNPRVLELFIGEFWSQIFDDLALSLLNNRLILMAYLIKLDNNKLFSQLLYSLTFESEFRNSFLTDYLKKSIYQYFLFQRDRYKSLKKSTSIFSRNSNKELSDIDINYVEQCLNAIEKEWI